MADLPTLREQLDRMAAMCGKKEVSVRLDDLYQKLQAGQIPDAVQEKLRSFATLPRSEAQKVLQDLISQYWQQHKYWLTGLKWLLGA